MNYNMINGINIVLDEPYPSIENLQSNKTLAYKIKKVYSGQKSELTCISKYIFQYISLDKEYKEIKNALRKISIVEMQHLDILGNMIKKLDLIPAFTYVNKIHNEDYWNSSYVNYEVDLVEMLKNNIKGEEKTIEEYQKIIKYADDEIVTDILNRIILDEEQHIKIFKSILNNLI